MASMTIVGPSLDRSGVVTQTVYYDDDAAELVEDWSWHLHPADTTWYAQAKVPAAYRDWFPGRHQVTMHQLVMHGMGSGRIGHLDGNGLNNRASNLRFMTQEMILAKRRPASHKGGKQTGSRYKGICWDKHYDKWVARFRGKNLGRFRDEIEAALVWDAAARGYWGDELPYQNFPTLPWEALMKDRVWAKAFGKKVRAARLHAKLTQQQVATRVGCTRSNIAQIERGAQDTPLHVALKIAEVLAVRIEDLLPTPTEDEQKQATA